MAVDAETQEPLEVDFRRWQEYTPTGETDFHESIETCQQISYCLATAPGYAPTFKYWTEVNAEGYKPKAYGIELLFVESTEIVVTLELENLE